MDDRNLYLLALETVGHWQDIKNIVDNNDKFKTETTVYGNRIYFLDKIVKRWKRLGIYAIDCPFCAKFKKCSGCPILKKTKHKNCNETPFIGVISGFSLCDLSLARRMVNKELSFLKEIAEEIKQTL